VSEARGANQPAPSEARRANQPAPGGAPNAGGPPGIGRGDLGLQPLTARSVILSVLLGSHPPLLPVRSLVRIAELFGITEGSARVALSRLAAEGDVVADGGRYRLSARLVARQRRQDEGRQPALQPWRGSWEMAVADRRLGGTADRAGLGQDLAALHLSELRPGTWVRPANLRRNWPESLGHQVWHFEARVLDPLPRGDTGAARALAATLWDLDGWADRARALLDALRTTQEPAGRFVLAAAAVRHLQLDPLLPASLVPARWPGARLRTAYADYELEVGRLLQDERARHAGAAGSEGEGPSRKGLRRGGRRGPATGPGSWGTPAQG